MKKCACGLGPLGFGSTTSLALGASAPGDVAADSSMYGSKLCTIASPASRTMRIGFGTRLIQ